MLRADKPTADFVRAKNPHDIQCYAAGIPYAYWHTLFVPSFSPFKLTDQLPLIPVSAQMDWWQRMLQPESWTKPYLVYICCPQDESRACDAAFHIGKSVLRAGRTIHVDRILDPDPVQADPVAILTGVSAEMTADRRQATRDWIESRKSLFRIVAAEGTSSDLSARLGIRPQVAFDIAHRVVQA